MKATRFSIRLKLGVSALLLCTAGVKAAPAYESLLDNQRFLDDRITGLVRLADPKAVAIVHLIVPKEKKELPGVPFYFEDYTISGADQIVVQRAEISIVTELEKLPEEINVLIKESVAPLTNQIKIKLRPFQKSIEKTDGAKPQNPNQELSWDQKLGERGSLTVGILAGAGCIALFCLALVWAVLGLKKGTVQISKVLSSEFTSLRDSLGEGVGAKAGAGGASADAFSGGTEAGRSEDANLFSELPLQSCLALLADCYWCEQDQYAAFLWEKLPVNKRTALLSSWPVLEKYVRTFQDLKAVDSGFHRDVNYLNPVGVERFSNAALSDLVKSHPTMLFRLSPMRSSSLSLTLQERADLMRKTQTAAALPDLSAISASIPRALEDKTRVRIGSEKQENEAFALKDFSVALKEQFVTLAWIVQLPKEEVTAILEGFNARELATAWIGPERLLKFMSECLPEKKRALVDSYRSAVAPSRDSETYLRLHQRTIGALKNVASAPRKQGYEKAA